jgi:hypothetical protein
MKHIKKFESFEDEKFDLGNYPVETREKEEECEPCQDDEGFPGGEWSQEDEFNPEDYPSDEDVEEEAEEHERRRLWGDEATVERISSFNNFVKEAKKAKPDFLDLDKDGDKKESMKKAAKDAKEDKKDNKKEDKKDNKKEDKKEETKGLSAAQKKLPPALQKAIAAKKK